MGKSLNFGKSIVAVDVFCGAAGLSLGLQQSGIDIAAGIDVDPSCRYPFEENIGAKFIQKDIKKVSASEVSELFGSARLKVLAGCAPCQPFSGYTTKRRDKDERWDLLFEFLRLARGFLPDILTIENVPRLSLLPLWKEVVAELHSLGYHTAWDILDASKFGVPQQRKRLVLVASRLAPISLPSPTYDEVATVETAIGMLPEIGAGTRNLVDPLHSSRALTQKNLERIRISRPAGSWRDWPEDMQVDCHKTDQGRTYPSVYGRMSWNHPAPTITTQFYGYGNGRFGHPVQDRAITLREGAILQSFPSDFKFVQKDEKVNFRKIGKLVGNAVPPKLALEIGRAIVKHVDSVV